MMEGRHDDIYKKHILYQLMLLYYNVIFIVTVGRTWISHNPTATLPVIPRNDRWPCVYILDIMRSPIAIRGGDTQTIKQLIITLHCFSYTQTHVESRPPATESQKSYDKILLFCFHSSPRKTLYTRTIVNQCQSALPEAVMLCKYYVIIILVYYYMLAVCPFDRKRNMYTNNNNITILRCVHTLLLFLLFYPISRTGHAASGYNILLLCTDYR